MNNFTAILDIQTTNDNINTYLNSEYRDYKASLRKSLGLHIAQICSIITGIVSLGSLLFLPVIQLSAGMFRLFCLVGSIAVAVFIISTALLICTDNNIFDDDEFDKSDLSFESFKDYYVNNHKSYVTLLYNVLNNTAESYNIVDILFTKTSSRTGDITIHYSIDNCVYYCIIKQIDLYDNMRTDLTDHTLDLTLDSTPDIIRPQLYMSYNFVSKLKNKYPYRFDIDDVTEKINNYRTERTINNDIQ